MPIFRLLAEPSLSNSGCSIILFWNGLINLKASLEKIDIMTIKSSLTILFENIFWIGLYERIDGDKYEVSKIILGAEPKDYEVYDFLQQNWHKLKLAQQALKLQLEQGKLERRAKRREQKGRIMDGWCGR